MFLWTHIVLFLLFPKLLLENMIILPLDVDKIRHKRWAASSFFKKLLRVRILKHIFLAKKFTHTTLLYSEFSLYFLVDWLTHILRLDNAQLFIHMTGQFYKNNNYTPLRGQPIPRGIFAAERQIPSCKYYSKILSKEIGRSTN